MRIAIIGGDAAGLMAAAAVTSLIRLALRSCLFPFSHLLQLSLMLNMRKK